MVLKPKARAIMLKQLSQFELEKQGYDLDSLSDLHLKGLYLKLQKYRQGRVRYALAKGLDFQESLVNGKLNFLSFTDTYRYGLRKLSFNECLIVEDFIKENPNIYSGSLWAK